MAKFEHMDDKEIRKYLAAFADGELDVEQNLRVLEQMAMNPDATRRVMHQQQLRQQVDRVMRAMVPPIDESLRDSIASLAIETASTSEDDVTGRKSPGGILARVGPWGQWLPALAAAFLLAASVTFWILGQSETAPTVAPITVVRAPNLLNAQRIQVLETRHEFCSQRIEELHNADRFGRIIGDLPSKITRFLGEQSTPILDLSALGYKFGGAGECAAPGAKAVHLVYRSNNAESEAGALSLWARADAENKIKVQAGKLYEVPRSDKIGSIVMWRRDGVVYYLVGNAAEEVKNAALALRDEGK